MKDLYSQVRKKWWQYVLIIIFAGFAIAFGFQIAIYYIVYVIGEVITFILRLFRII